MNNKIPPPSRWVTEDVLPMLEFADGSSPTVTARCGNAGIVNMMDLAHYPIQGVLVQEHYEETDIIQP